MQNNKAEVLQASLDAEVALLGSILIESTRGTREAINEVAKFLKPSDFRSEQNRRIFSAILSCPGPPHEINVAEQLHALNLLQDGDCSHLCLCVASVPCSLDYSDYAKAVLHYSEEREGKKVSIVRGAH